MRNKHTHPLTEKNENAVRADCDSAISDHTIWVWALTNDLRKQGTKPLLCNTEVVPKYAAVRCRQCNAAPYTRQRKSHLHYLCSSNNILASVWICIGPEIWRSYLARRRSNNGLFIRESRLFQCWDICTTRSGRVDISWHVLGFRVSLTGAELCTTRKDQDRQDTEN